MVKGAWHVADERSGASESERAQVISLHLLYSLSVLQLSQSGTRKEDTGGGHNSNHLIKSGLAKKKFFCQASQH